MNVVVQITAMQLDDIAAAFRARGQSQGPARAEWVRLSDVDRDWWRKEVARILWAGKVRVAS